MKKKYKSELLGSLYETAMGLHKIGVIGEKEMRDYDKDCLIKEPKMPDKTESPAKIERISRAAV